MPHSLGWAPLCSLPELCLSWGVCLPPAGLYIPWGQSLRLPCPPLCLQHWLRPGAQKCRINIYGVNALRPIISCVTAFLVLFYNKWFSKIWNERMTTELNQIKPRHNIVSQAAWTSVVRLLLKSQVLCTASFSLLLKKPWRILCSLRSEKKKAGQRGGEFRRKNLILFHMEIKIIVKIIRLNCIKHFLCGGHCPLSLLFN